MAAKLVLRNLLHNNRLLSVLHLLIQIDNAVLGRAVQLQLLKLMIEIW